MKKLLLSLTLLFFSQTLLFGQNTSTFIGENSVMSADSLNTSVLGNALVGNAYDVCVIGNYAYVVNYDDGLHIIDISNSANPTEVGHLDLEFSVNSVFVSGNYAYITAYANGLRIIDISNVSSPTEVGSYDRSWDSWSSASDVSVVGTLAYVLFGSSGLHVLDISDLANISDLASYMTAGITQSIEVNGDYAFIASGSSGLRILNISDLANITEVGFFDTDGDAVGVFLSGNFVYIADASNGLRIISISDVTNPSEIGAYNPWSDLVGVGNIIGITVAGDFAYVAAYNKGLRILDISDVTTPSEVGYYDHKTNGGIRNNVVNNNKIFSVNEKGLYVINYEGATNGTNSTLKGKVTNAVDGTPISGALVAVGQLTTTTDADGNYEIADIPTATLNATFSGTPLSGGSPLEVSFTDQSNEAAHTLVVSATGFSTYANNQVVINEGETLSIDVSLSPTLTTGEMRIVLNWGSAPNDLDSYLVTPDIDGNTYTVYYNDPGEAVSAPYVTLDHDDINAFGPETITIYQRHTGTYKYYVYNYSASPDITTSNGVVQVYTGAGLVSTVNIPSSGSGLYWNVLTIDGATGNVTVTNTINDLPPNVAPTMPNKIINSVQLSKLADGTESISSWTWSFGDGATSTAQNPKHTYTVAGDYTVTLVASNGTDNSTETKTNYISVSGGSSSGGIVSITTGGLWGETTTWIGGVVPTAEDDVVIDGRVEANYSSTRECKNLTINSGKTLTCSDNGIAILVGGDIINNGTIEDNDWMAVYIDVKGNMTNNGVWENYQIEMNGTTDQTFANNDFLHAQFNFISNVPSATTFQWYKDGVTINDVYANGEVYYYTKQASYEEYNPYGEYYCQTNAGNSRKMTIVKESLESEEVLAENFDGSTFPPNGWTQTITNTSNTWKQGNPDENNFSSFDATNVFSALCPWVAEDQNELLKSPIVALPDDEINLEFYAGYGTDWLSSATMKLNISIDGGTNWTNLWEANNDGNGWQWRKVLLELDSYKNNSNVMFGWQYVGNDGDLVGIDNVKITSGVVGIEESLTAIPTEFALNQNYPNPFNPTTIISYQLPSQGFVSINIYNILGQKITSLVNKSQSAGSHQLNFDASNLSAGTYIYQLKAGDFVQSKKMLLLK